MIEKCCGTCKYHWKDEDGDWVCNNEESDYYTAFSEYGDCGDCEDWEERT